MFAKSCPKVSLQSRLSRESYDAKFGIDECARNNYGVTLTRGIMSVPDLRSRGRKDKCFHRRGFSALYVMIFHILQSFIETGRS